MKIVIGADHRGFYYKESLKEQINIGGVDIEWVDVGASDDTRSDYPLFAQLVCQTMRQDNIERGVLICASGGGMAVAANRYKGIYAVVAWNTESAMLAASDDKANVLVVPASFVDDPSEIVSSWLHTPFLGGRYQRRIDMIDALGGI